MKRVIAFVVMMMLFATVVNASGMYGTYKGNPIVKVKINGTEQKTTDVPAISMQGRVMVPLNMLRAAGAEVTWDNKTQTASVTTKSGSSSKDIVSYLSSVSEKVDRLGGSYLTLAYDETGPYMSVSYSAVANYDEDVANISALTEFVANTEAAWMYVYVYSPASEGSVYTGNVEVSREDAEAYVNGKLTEEHYFDSWVINSTELLGDAEYDEEDAYDDTAAIELYSFDGEVYLGQLTSDDTADSVFNEKGEFGGKTSANSIWNPKSKYGGETSDEGVFNKKATKPPAIYFYDELIGYLTANPDFEDGVHPDELMDWLLENGF
ncbi:stalk domain-containing protein [Paenibacillus thermotolerans]|uniref:stalk domain-containing protein n=1 Tax=Paenibacillus thermotolerans TaxID=3027807 RepID=UPI002368A21C|nr:MULTISPECIES: stalk domain-containing protein [unclassified Paenibacillus]